MSTTDKETRPCLPAPVPTEGGAGRRDRLPCPAIYKNAEGIEHKVISKS